MYICIFFKDSNLHPESKYLHENVGPLDLGGQHAGWPGIRQGRSLPPVGARQALDALGGLKHGFGRQVILRHQVNLIKNKVISKLNKDVKRSNRGRQFM